LGMAQKLSMGFFKENEERVECRYRGKNSKGIQHGCVASWNPSWSIFAT